MASPVRPAHLVLRNARIHTVDPAFPEAQAMAVVDGRIAWLGSDEDALGWTGPGTQVIDAEGKLVLPGFVDAHNHVRLGSDDACVQLSGATTLDEVHARIRAWHTANPDAEWIEAEAFDYSAIPDGRMPTAADLDPATGDVPAFVLSYDVHTAWVNTAGLRALGIDRDRTHLPFGAAVTDPVTGEPTGFIKDFAVKGLSRDGHRALQQLGLPWASADRQYGRLAKSLDDAIRFGITTVVEPQNSLDDLQLFDRARTEGLPSPGSSPPSSTRAAPRTPTSTTSPPPPTVTTTTGSGSGRSSSTSTTWWSRGPRPCWSPTRAAAGTGATPSTRPRSSPSC